MALLIGIERIDLTDPQQPYQECPSCGHVALVVQLQVHWFQMLGLPLVPLGAQAEPFCRRCGCCGAQAGRGMHLAQRARALARLGWVPILGCLITAASLLAAYRLLQHTS